MLVAYNFTFTYLCVLGRCMVFLSCLLLIKIILKSVRSLTLTLIFSLCLCSAISFDKYLLLHCIINHQVIHAFNILTVFLVYLVAITKYHRLVVFLEAEKPNIKGLAQSRLVRAPFRAADFSSYPHVLGGARELCAIFFMTVIPCTRAPPSWPNHLPEATLPNIIITFVGRNFSMWISGW